MAILNFMVSGTYTSIEEVLFQKRERNIFASLCVCKDSTREEILHSLSITIDSAGKAVSVSGTATPTYLGDGTVDVAPLEQAGQAVILDDSGSDYHNYVFYDDGSGLALHPPYEGFLLKRDDEGKLYKFSSGDFAEQPSNVLSDDSFDAIFGNVALDVAGNNITKAIYGQVHLRPEFAGAISDEA